MKHTQLFDAFLKEEVNIDQGRLDWLNGHVKAVREFLSQNLDPFVKVEQQGSYALRTIIKPVQERQEYDADILLYMKRQNGWQPKDYIEALYKCLRTNGNYSEKARRKTRCVELDYAGDFHLDIVPCLTRADGKQYICNYQTNGFESTDGTGYRDWFNERTNLTHGNLKRVTRLLKHLRDHKGNYTAPSILLTTLIGNTVRDQYDGDNFKTLPEALQTVSNRINDFLQAHQRMPRIANPALPTEDFTRKWDQQKYLNFREQFRIANARINEAMAATEAGDSVRKWQRVFGDSFGKGRNTGGGSSKTSPSRKAGTVSVNPPRPYAR